jgi:hypothetical protein
MITRYILTNILYQGGHIGRKCANLCYILFILGSFCIGNSNFGQLWWNMSWAAFWVSLFIKKSGHPVLYPIFA